MKSPFDDTDRTTICDRCGSEIDLAEANYAGPELPLWEGATLCNDCYANAILTKDEFSVETSVGPTGRGVYEEL
jgi:hypothetical protein